MYSASVLFWILIWVRRSESRGIPDLCGQIYSSQSRFPPCQQTLDQPSEAQAPKGPAPTPPGAVFKDDWRSYVVGDNRDSRGAEASSSLFEGDILNLEKGTFHATKGSFMANALRNPDMKWPDGLVPYEISPQISHREQNLVRQAMDTFHKKTCVRFIPRRNEKDYLSIQSNQGCNSYIGKIGGAQPMSLQSGQCSKQGKVEHELMHALGFTHEQSRTDRDQYVVINWDNIPKDSVENFQKYGSDVIDSLGAEYDYGSIMHYGPFYFATDPTQWTILPRVKGKEIGQRRTLSDIDVWKVNQLYNCFPSTPNPDEVSSTPVPECMDGWIRFSNSCYYFSHDNKREMLSWSDANDVCRAMLSHLVWINDEVTNQFLAKKQRDTMWIGSRQKDDQYSWYPVTGASRFVFTNWVDDEPKNCVLLNERGKWQMENCEVLKDFVCEMPLYQSFPAAGLPEQVTETKAGYPSSADTDGLRQSKKRRPAVDTNM